MRFAVEGSDVLRPIAPEEIAQAIATGHGNNAAAYPLVPFSNRIAHGRLPFDGREIRLKPNWPGVAHPMHGDGWSRRWDVLRSDERSAEIGYDHDDESAGGGWPFRYRVRQSYRLDDQQLVIHLSVQNLERQAVPVGLGLHPFFVRDAETELACRTAAVWLGDAEVLPTERVDVPPQWDFSTLRRVDDLDLDNCFDGWDGRATIVWPRRGLRLELAASEPFRHVVIYVPPQQPYFCVEPVSHANGQVGASLLAAGATLAGEIAFRLSNL
jgi:aldose 1-epimerase